MSCALRPWAFGLLVALASPVPQASADSRALPASTDDRVLDQLTHAIDDEVTVVEIGPVEIGQRRQRRRAQRRRAQARRARRARARRRSRRAARQGRRQEARARRTRERRTRARTEGRAQRETAGRQEESAPPPNRERRRRVRRERPEPRGPQRQHSRHAPVFDLHVGARVEARLARFETNDGNARRNQVAYPTLTALLRARPLSNEDGPERGLEFRANFAYAVGLSSRNTLTDEAVDTQFWRLYLDAAMMFEVDRAVELGLGFGFGFDAYALGAQSIVVVPSAEYPYLRPHLRGRFQLAGETAVLEIGLAYRAVLDRGGLSEHFGAGGDAHGFDVTTRLGGSIDVGFSYGIEAGVAGYVHSFEGVAVTAPGRSGSDVGLWLGAQLGYAFR